VRRQRLLKEGQQRRHNNASLDAFSHAHKKHCTVPTCQHRFDRTRIWVGLPGAVNTEGMSGRERGVKGLKKR
jgi:hypothetical protein